MRRQSVDPADLFHGHIGAIDALALALERAARMLEQDALAEFKAKRYAGWDGEFGKEILSGRYTLESLAKAAVERDLKPQHISGQQEALENLVNRYIYG